MARRANAVPAGNHANVGNDGANDQLSHNSLGGESDIAQQAIGDSGGPGFETLNPAELGTDAGTGTDAEQPKKRGRKPGVRNATKTATAKDVQNLAVTIKDALDSIHGALYFFTQSQLWQISEPETERVADRMSAVAAFYVDVKVPTKVGAWFNLGVALTSVYVMRLLVMRAMIKAGVPASAAQQAQQFQGMDNA